MAVPTFLTVALHVSQLWTFGWNCSLQYRASQPLPQPYRNIKQFCQGTVIKNKCCSLISFYIRSSTRARRGKWISLRRLQKHRSLKDLFFCAWNEQIQTLKNNSETIAPALVARNLWASWMPGKRKKKNLSSFTSEHRNYNKQNRRLITAK